MLARLILGVLVTMTSVGAGALGTVTMVRLYPYRLNPAKLVGTDLAAALPLVPVADMGHRLIGNVDFALLGRLLLGSIPGIVAGSLISTRAPAQWVARAIVVALAIIGVRLLA